MKGNSESGKLNLIEAYHPTATSTWPMNVDSSENTPSSVAQIKDVFLFNPQNNKKKVLYTKKLLHENFSFLLVIVYSDTNKPNTNYIENKYRRKIYH